MNKKVGEMSKEEKHLFLQEKVTKYEALYEKEEELLAKKERNRMMNEEVLLGIIKDIRWTQSISDKDLQEHLAPHFSIVKLMTASVAQQTLVAKAAYADLVLIQEALQFFRVYTLHHIK